MDAAGRRADFPSLATAYEQPPTATAALAGLTVDALRRLAVPATGETLRGLKSELVASVAATLDGDGPRRMFQTLGEFERAAVAEAVHAPHGRFDHGRFRAKYGGDPRWGSLRSRGEVLPTALDVLFCGDRTLPVDVRDRLRGEVPPPIESCVQATGEPSGAIVVQTEHAAQRDVMAVLRLVEADSLRISPRIDQRPTATTLRAVADVLDGGDFYADEESVGPIKAFAWPLLVEAAGLATAAGSRLALTRAAGRAGRLAGRHARRRVEQVAVHHAARRAVPDRRHQRAARPGPARAHRRRPPAAAITAALSACPVGQWVSVDELFRHMRAGSRLRRHPRRLGPVHTAPEHGSLGYDGCGGWNILQARYALALLLEYAATSVSSTSPSKPRPAPAPTATTTGAPTNSSSSAAMTVSRTSA